MRRSYVGAVEWDSTVAPVIVLVGGISRVSTNTVTHTRWGAKSRLNVNKTSLSLPSRKKQNENTARCNNNFNPMERSAVAHLWSSSTARVSHYVKWIKKKSPNSKNTTNKWENMIFRKQKMWWLMHLKRALFCLTKLHNQRESHSSFCEVGKNSA